MEFLLKFADATALELERSGGKGANLAHLSQHDFPVPPGWIVTTPVYRTFIDQADGLRDRVSRLPFDDPQLLREESAKLRADLARLDLPDRAIAQIREALRDETSPVSVRSSSTMEDLAGAAFAGQHDTYLNVSGVDTILEKVKACFLSLWEDRAIAYRHHQGFDHVAAAMAVVIQRMAPCEVAGVGFTINPVSGRLGEMVIDANYGLGESVVSGEGEVDHDIIDKATMKVLERRIARKTVQVVASDEGVRSVPVDDGSRDRPCLDERELARLGELMVRVERSYQFPQDIEWGYVAGEFLLLQSRPITTIPPHWTRDESAERFPNVITPLTWDLVESGFHRSLNYSFRLMGYPPFNGKWFALHNHYVYGNQNAVEIYGRRIPVMFRTLDELRSQIPALVERFRWVQDLPVHWYRDLDFYLLKIGEFMSEPLDDKSLQELWEYVLHVNEHGAQYFLPNIAISITQGALHRLLFYCITLVAGEANATRLFDALLAFCETRTGEINRELYEIAQLIRERPDFEAALFEAGSSRSFLESGTVEAFPEFDERFRKFLRDHGHREIDFDAYHPTWLEAPWVVLDNLKLILHSAVDETPTERERTLRRRMQEAERELFGLIPDDLSLFFSEILRLTRLYTSLDDLEHYQTTRLTLPLRRGIRALGERLLCEMVLDDPMDLFFAHRDALASAIEKNSAAEWERLAVSIVSGKKGWLEVRERKPDWELGVSRPTEPGDGVLSGIPGSPGVAEGVVSIVRGSDEFARFPKGAVLVARTTGPAWTPLFYSAVAVVTESGGPLSHGAVTAREMQIPAVMAVRNCMEELKNGQRVRVDGSTGQVTVLSDG